MSDADFRAMAGKLRLYREHPGIMAREMFGIIPDAWQDKVFEQFPHEPRIALQACTGPGKSLTLAVIGWNFLLTRPHPAIGVASISGANLKANLWAEMSRLYNRSQFLKEMFEVTATAIYNREHQLTWKMEARSWAQNANEQQIGAALKGLHANYVMWLLDETGAMPSALLPAVEGIFSGDPIEAHIVQAGNPISRQGMLFRAAVTARRLWAVTEITADPDDPLRTPRVSVQHAREQIEQWGIDNPWVRINILGKFPAQDVNSLIGEDEVLASFRRYYRDHEIGDAPRVLGVDVALEGDDASVIFKRRGIQAFPHIKYRNINSTQGAGQVSRMWSDWDADACFIDGTGGFGAGWCDQLRNLGRAPISVLFSASAHQKDRYYNKRTEMYFDAVEWIKAGGALCESPELLAALTQTTYAFHGDRLLLEPKKDIKRKLGYSPDEADAFCLTFAEPVTVQKHQFARTVRSAVQSDYSPFAGMDNAASSSYDPFRQN